MVCTAQAYRLTLVVIRRTLVVMVDPIKGDPDLRVCTQVLFAVQRLRHRASHAAV
jgi:hypothetical protein